MADSSTVRANRSRKHRVGDHSLCLPERCPALAGSFQDGDREPPPSGDALRLGAVGRKLWNDASGGIGPGPLQAMLLLEACRISDRLDKLDRQLRGEDWLRFRHSPDDEHEITVHIDRVLAEAREQEMAFKNIVVELTKNMPAVKAAPVKGGGVLVDLAARLAARSAQTQG